MEIRPTDDGRLECYVADREGALIHQAAVGVLMLAAAEDCKGLSRIDAIAVVDYVSRTTGIDDMVFSIPETAAGIFSACIKDYRQILIDTKDQALADELAQNFWLESQAVAVRLEIPDGLWQDD